MKKLYAIALTMILSIDIAQAYNQGGNQNERQQHGGQQKGGGRQGNEHRNEKRGNENRSENQHGDNKGHMPAMMSQADIEKEIGGTLSFDMVSTYAESYAQDLKTLSTSSTPEQIQAVMKKGMVINEAIKTLLPRPEMSSGKPAEMGNKGNKPNMDRNMNHNGGHNNNSDKGGKGKQQKGNGPKNTSHGPMRRPMPQQNQSQQQQPDNDQGSQNDQGPQQDNQDGPSDDHGPQQDDMGQNDQQ